METDIKLIDYSDKAIAIATEYDCAFQDEFKLIGGRFNSWLSFGAGWIFSRKKHEGNLRGMFEFYGLSVSSVTLSDMGVSNDKTDTDSERKTETPEYILTDKERKEWAKDDYEYKYYKIVVRLTGGECVPIGLDSIKSEFWFPDENHDEEINDARSEEYFIAENTDKLQLILDILNGTSEHSYKFGWLANWYTDNRNHWNIDKSNICPWATNAVDCLDYRERDMYDKGLYKQISDEDKQRLIAGYKFALETMQKRCRAWLKRYGVEKISVRTYWADR